MSAMVEILNVAPTTNGYRGAYDVTFRASFDGRTEQGVAVVWFERHAWRTVSDDPAIWLEPLEIVFGLDTPTLAAVLREIRVAACEAAATHARQAKEAS